MRLLSLAVGIHICLLLALAQGGNSGMGAGGQVSSGASVRYKAGGSDPASLPLGTDEIDKLLKGVKLPVRRQPLCQDCSNVDGSQLTNIGITFPTMTSRLKPDLSVATVPNSDVIKLEEMNARMLTVLLLATGNLENQEFRKQFLDGERTNGQKTTLAQLHYRLTFVEGALMFKSGRSKAK